MLRTRVIPVLLLKSAGLVKTVRFSNPKYVGDPINAVKIFNDKYVDELVFLDITATCESRTPAFDVIARIAGECFMPLAYGGGIRSIEDAKTIFNSGVEKIVVNSFAHEIPEFIKEASDIFGSQSIVVSIDVKKNWLGHYEVYSHSGTRRCRINPIDHSRRMEQLGAGELFINSIERDGTMDGYDIPLIRSISEAVDIPVIACGGAGKLQDFVDAVVNGKSSAIAAGSMFVFHGKHRAVLISYLSSEDIEYLNRKIR